MENIQETPTITGKLHTLLSISLTLSMLGLLVWIFAAVIMDVGHSASSVVTAPFAISCITHSMDYDCKKPLYGQYLSWEDKQNMDIGDVVLYDPRCQENRNTWLCDSVNYYYGSARIVHRIIGFWPDGTYKAQGDNNPTPDDIHIKPAMVLWRVTRQ